MDAHLFGVAAAPVVLPAPGEPGGGGDAALSCGRLLAGIADEAMKETAPGLCKSPPFVCDEREQKRQTRV
jgi:hypothetical protein